MVLPDPLRKPEKKYGLSGGNDLPMRTCPCEGPPPPIAEREEVAEEAAPGAEPQSPPHGRGVPRMLKVITITSHAQTLVSCVGCSTVLCQPTGGKARLTEGCSFFRKQHYKHPESR